MKKLCLLLAITMLVTGCLNEEKADDISNNAQTTTAKVVTEKTVETDITEDTTEIITTITETENTAETVSVTETDNATTFDINDFETVAEFIKSKALGDAFTLVEGDSVEKFEYYPNEYHMDAPFFQGELRDLDAVILDTGVSGRLVEVILLGETQQKVGWFVDEEQNILYTSSDNMNEFKEYSRLYTPHNQYNYLHIVAGRRYAKRQYQPIMNVEEFTEQYAGFLDELTYQNDGKSFFWDLDELMKASEEGVLYGETNLNSGYEYYPIQKFLLGYINGISVYLGFATGEFEKNMDEIMQIGADMAKTYMENGTYDKELFEQIKNAQYLSTN
ncbi:MAG: hypothetical protein LBM93_01090 [Oscillospiraceae bacterium]|jgi:outer membrane murein-binding lipoprotein Lpp|nr:hypothetical protein [Oscillospiraceae bacterium]